MIGNVFPSSKALRAGVLLTSLMVMLSAVLANAEVREFGDNRMPSLAPMLESVTPAVVNIAVTRSQRIPDPMRFFGGPDLRAPSANGEGAVRRSRGAGSGVVVDSIQGYIVTNHHVVAGADNISVGLEDGRIFEASLIGSDQQTDIALLRIEAEGLSALRFADAEGLRVGDYVVAIGNPFGIGQTVTSGIISALGRAGINNENYEDFIQTDAAINVGNSGGALVDLNGRLVGINTAIISGTGTSSGVGFAVPVDMVEAVVGHLARDGVVHRGQLGVLIRDHSPLMEGTLRLGADRGALITQVVPGSAADQAGLKVSDLVTAIDGRQIRGGRELRNAVGLAGVEQPLAIDVLRDGEPIRVLARLIGTGSESALASRNQGASERSQEETRFFGAQLRNSHAGDEAQGVVVSSVDQQSRAWAAGLRPGDVVQQVNREPTGNLRQFNSLVGAEPSVIALGVLREGQPLLLIVS